ncbi:deoxyribose-phosphate aldolase [Opitutus terrae]|uniref:Deoxyribose-phosphate aldolase n=1 Tax=Opitutus terrae (strain DSM 11246 / JCM 15787 / PB90-1) TaxID=452637 RepID=B1ZSQ8_OPITP|nr:deoxyribose-phosphate aldolase [Opitutus terrae]ACB74809.1 deoxyribose-phosphate aldolase [Opitutus terrae PB90-1]
MTLTPAALAATFDSTNLRLDATDADLAKLAEEAATHHFAAVMLYPTGVAAAAERLRGTGVKVGTVIGFPSGRFTTAAKAAEIEAVCAAGANEVDIVLNYAALREGYVSEVAAEVATLTARAHALGALIKVIAETCYLDSVQRLGALRLCEDAGADFIKTSTGFGSAGAKVEHIRDWASQRRGKIQLKAAGGIKTLADARALIEAGATRLGTSSAAAILAELTSGMSVAATSGSY